MDINSQIEGVLLKYPSLSYDKFKNKLEGKLFISELDYYEVEIDIEPYPLFFPTVYEVGERISKKAYRHIYTDTGSCCFTTKAKSQILLKTKILTLSLFIDEIVMPYFQNNSYYELNKKYNTEEYSHTKFVVVEGYRDILRTSNDVFIAKLIYRRVMNEKMKIQHQCYCGSGKSMKRCENGLHDKCFKEFKKIDKNLLERDFAEHFVPILKKSEIIK